MALDKSAAHYDRARERAIEANLPEKTLQSVNEQLVQAARKLTSEQGLPGRPWMRNLIYAPGKYTGYDAKTLPGVREAIEEHRYAEADAQIVLVGHAIENEATYVEHLAEELDSSSGEQNIALRN